MLIVDISNSLNLSKPLGRVAGAAGKRDELQSCVLVQADSERGLTLTCVDSHTHELRLRVPDVAVAQEGAVVLKAATFKELVGTLDNEPVTLAFDEDSNSLQIEAMKMGVFKDPPEAFPVEPELPPVVGLVEAERLTEAIRAATELCEDGEMVVLVSEGDQLRVYTRERGVMFSVTTLQVYESSLDWRIAVPAALFKHLPPNMTATAQLRLHENLDTFAIANGYEHLLIRQVANDNYSHVIDDMLKDPAPDFAVVVSDPLARDLKRAAIFKANSGLRLGCKGERLTTACKSPIGSLNGSHVLENSGGSFTEVNVDPELLAKAVKTLGGTQLVIEQVKTLVDALDEDEVPEEAITLRLSDPMAPEHRSIVLGTLGV